MTKKDPELGGFLKQVEGHMWGMSAEDRQRALLDLGNHLKETAEIMERRTHAESAMDLAIMALPSPEVIGKGCRRLYGYSADYRLAFILGAVLFSFFTQPLYPLASTLTLPLTFFMIVLSGREAGLGTGMAAGFAAALTRTAMAGAMFTTAGGSYEFGPPLGLLYFLTTTALMAICGMMAGLVHEEDLKRAIGKQASRFQE